VGFIAEVLRDEHDSVPLHSLMLVPHSLLRSVGRLAAAKADCSAAVADRSAASFCPRANQSAPARKGGRE
jgi:hypothetical protein